VADLLTVNGEDDVARTQVGATGRSLGSNAEDDDALLQFAGEYAEPRPRRAVGPAEPEHVVEYGRKQIDRHDHVERCVDPVANALQLQGADADEVAGCADQSGSAPMGV